MAAAGAVVVVVAEVEEIETVEGLLETARDREIGLTALIGPLAVLAPEEKRCRSILQCNIRVRIRNEKFTNYQGLGIREDEIKDSVKDKDSCFGAFLCLVLHG